MKYSKIPMQALAVAVAAALVLPIAAYGQPGKSGTKGSGGGQVTAAGKPTKPARKPKPKPPKPKAPGDKRAAQKAAQARKLAVLKQRIGAALGHRRVIFESIATRILDRVAATDRIADKAASAGGDVSSVRSKLARAGAAVDEARSAESEAVRLFGLVPGSSHKQAAFKTARARAAAAQMALQTARVDLSNAILDLRVILNGLKGVEG